jgi:hypothetical protein
VVFERLESPEESQMLSNVKSLLRMRIIIIFVKAVSMKNCPWMQLERLVLESLTVMGL